MSKYENRIEYLDRTIKDAEKCSDYATASLLILIALHGISIWHPEDLEIIELLRDTLETYNGSNTNIYNNAIASAKIVLTRMKRLDSIKSEENTEDGEN